MQDDGRQGAGVPALQSFTEYIAHHFMDELTEAVEGYILTDTVQGAHFGREGCEIRAERRGARILHANYWREDRTHLLADVMLRIQAGAGEPGQIPCFGTHHICFSVRFTLDGGIRMDPLIREVSAQGLPDRRGVKLSRYLIPVLSYAEMEALTQRTVMRCLGQSERTDYDDTLHQTLPQAMGLTVKRLSLFEMDDTESILFLCGGTVEVHPAEPGEGRESETAEVPARTIVLNSRCASSHHLTARAICHECGHWEWHSMFYELQQLHCSDLETLRYARARELTRPMQRDLSWVERQARYFSIAALLPEEAVRALIARPWREAAAREDWNAGERYCYVINVLHRDRLIPKYLTKQRLVGMGMKAAKGACNYVDEQRIDNFAFDPERLGAHETYVIGRGQVSRLYEDDEAFRKLIDSRVFVYADGHLCVNSPQYVTLREGRQVLTAWARDHADLCCLRFRRVWSSSAAGYTVGMLHSDDEYNRSYLRIHAMDVAGLDPAETDARNRAYLEDFPRTPDAALRRLIHDRCRTQRDFAVLSGLSDATVSRMCNDRDYGYSLEQVTRIVIGLSLPPALSSMFMELVGFTRAVMLRHLRHQCVIDCMFMDDIETVSRTHPDLFRPG